MIQLYCGDGKGKTTAAVGLLIRAAGRNIDTLFVQFLKDDTSGEIEVIKKLDNVEIMHADCFYGFVKNMTEEQKCETKEAYNKLLDSVQEYVSKHEKCVVILDEIVHAINYELVDITKMDSLLNMSNENIEYVLTGRNPSEKLIGMSDYYTEFKKQKHVYDKGIIAREGIEY